MRHLRDQKTRDQPVGAEGPFWTILELGNGIGHSALALSLGGYFPGLMTAPLLLLFAGVWPFSRFVKAADRSSHPKEQS